MNAKRLHPTGTGIGLTITKRAMECMGGKIGVECQSDKKTFTLYFKYEGENNERKTWSFSS